jgi:hypothetical protein
MNKFTFVLLFSYLSITTINVSAQNDAATQTESQNESPGFLKSKKDKKTQKPETKASAFIKEHMELGGFLQFQWNYCTKPDSITVNSASGGYFNRGLKNQFTLRRGRFVVGYHDKYSEVKIQMDLNERGIFLNDFYGKLKDPWLNVFELTGGIFMRPFGFETPNPSRLRETPERAMVIQNLFPNQRDMGAMLTVKAPDSSKAHGLAFFAAAFGGNSGKSETSYKDFVGQLRFDRDFNTAVPFHLGLGVSGLYGDVRHVYDLGSGDPQSQKYIYKYGITDTFFTAGFVADSAKTFKAGRYGGKVPKYYYGFDVELGVKWKLGETKIRTEFIAGQQVSKEGNLVNPYNFTTISPTGYQLGATWSFFNSPNSYNPAFIKQLDGPAHTFIRKFQGGHVTFVHEFTKPKLFVTFRYEWYDPNTDVKGNQISLVDVNGGLTNMSPADVKYQIIQAGIGYKITKNIKVSFHYDHVKNERTLIEPVPFNNDLINASFIYPNSGWKEDVKDDILTLRLQIGF